MTVFIDTSALYAVLDADDQNHARARDVWIDFLTQETNLICTNYVLVETFALVQNRLGLEAVRTLQEDILPVLHVMWIDETSHKAGVTALLTVARRHLSLVDCTSFGTMRELGIKTAFVFDDHFAEQGFECIP